MRLELLTKAQTFELFDQMKKNLLYYADHNTVYREFFTVHALTVRFTTVYVEVDWIYFNHDVYVTNLKFTTKEEYEQIRSSNN